MEHTASVCPSVCGMELDFSLRNVILGAAVDSCECSRGYQIDRLGRLPASLICGGTHSRRGGGWAPWACLKPTARTVGCRASRSAIKRASGQHVRP